MKLFITVTGPMIPVSMLEAQISRELSPTKLSRIATTAQHTRKRKPPKEHSVVARTYRSGSRNGLLRRIFVMMLILIDPACSSSARLCTVCLSSYDMPDPSNAAEALLDVGEK